MRIRSFSIRSPLAEYNELVKASSISQDAHQLKALHAFERLFSELLAYQAPEQRTWRHSMGLVDPKPIPKGIYIHGGVGSGKTYLMDLFSRCCNSLPNPRKRRMHFNPFLNEVHSRLHALRGQGNADILDHLTLSMSRDTFLFCFDEFQVTDIADALILQSLFTGLWRRGCVLVATSNRPPEQLYAQGLQRHLFLPFVGLLRDHCQVVDMDSIVDHRNDINPNRTARSFFYPLDASADAALSDALGPLTPEGWVEDYPIQVAFNRRLVVSRAHLPTRLASVEFSELCERNVGASDYLSLAGSFETVAVRNVPRMDGRNLDVLRRFITLVDCLYDNHVRLLVTAERPPEELFDPTGVSDSRDEVFAFQRTLSRLNETTQVQTGLSTARLTDCWENLLTLEARDVSSVRETVDRVCEIKISLVTANEVSALLISGEESAFEAFRGVMRR
jgi:predicted ATPase